jgi:hypothetical protein
MWNEAGKHCISNVVSINLQHFLDCLVDHTLDNRVVLMKKGKEIGWFIFGAIAIFGNLAVAINFGGNLAGDVALAFAVVIFFCWFFLAPYALKEVDANVH